MCWGCPVASSNQKNRGFALVAVIWFAGLLAIVSTSVAISLRSHTIANLGALRVGKTEFIADGLARFVAYRLAHPQDGATAYELNGQPLWCRWDDETVAAIAVQDQAGLIDLNTAAGSLVEALLEGLGETAEDSHRLAALIRDYRDPDLVSDEGQDESIPYEGSERQPKNKPFDVPEELDQVAGIDDALYRSLLPYVTTSSAAPGIALHMAPPVLIALLNDRREEIAAVSIAAPPAIGSKQALVIDVALAGGARFVREALIHITGQPDRPLVFLSWRRGYADVNRTMTVKSSLPDCLN